MRRPEKSYNNLERNFQKANASFNPLGFSIKSETFNRHGNSASNILNKAKTKTFGG